MGRDNINKTKKILYVLNTGEYSGAENVVIQIIKELDKSKYRGVYIGLNGGIEKRLVEEKISNITIDSLAPWKLKKIIKKIRPDVIHTNDYTATCVIVACFPSVPVIAHLHNNSMWIKKINIRSLLFAICSLGCKKIITVSPSILKEFVFSNLIANKTECIGNPIDINGFRNKYPYTVSKEYDVLVLGRLSEAKNPIFALKILRETKKYIDINAVFVGDGELREVVESYISKNKMSAYIELAGFKENPYEYIAKSKVALMPSKWEGFGLAAVENLAYGVPVVSSEVGGLPEIINNRCGKICHSLQEYVEEIKKLLIDDNYYKLKSMDALEQGEQLDNKVTYFNRIVQIYDGI